MGDNFFGGLMGLIILVLDIWAVVNVIQSNATTGAKILWSLGIIFFPVVGLIVWFFAGPRAVGRAAA